MESHLDRLEAESIYIFREIVAQFARPIMLYSVGKDSSVLLRLAQKAFAPGKIPFPLLHIDTGFKFPEMYEFRDETCRTAGAELIVYRNERAIADGANPFELGTEHCCRLLKTQALLEALRLHKVDAAIGGARREEERSRAKERVFSFRDQFGQWEPRNQRPELWSLLNGKVRLGESIRAFPLSNWTEIDIWEYILRERIPVASLYFSRIRQVLQRGNMLIPITSFAPLKSNESPVALRCRFRTLGCMPCTGAVVSEADTVPKIIAELQDTRVSERKTRVIDYDQDASMELKKREGYF
ncbi:MAG: sulfate adenylyltransferase subunit CysD [Oligoflexia bacterium]|nr:sulfate adenylyltransferase subunit CysD [Oligoflexia bacterium]